MVVTSSSVSGQSLSQRIRANIPFDFTVKNEKLPAGEYFIDRALPSSGDLILALDGRTGRESAFLTSAVQSLAPKRTAILVFHRYGDEYFLFQVWAAGAKTGRAISKSRREREIERKAGGSAGTASQKAIKSEIVSIAVDSQ